MERAVEATTRLRAPLTRVREVLHDDPGRALADAVVPEERSRRVVPVELAVDVGSTAAVEHEVLVQLGTLSARGDEVVVPLSWKPIGHERLLPDFDGSLVARVDDDGHTQLVLGGVYDIPFGAVGRFGDSLVGRRVARRSLASLLERVAGRLDAEVDRRAEDFSWRPAPYPVDLREGAGPARGPDGERRD